MKLPVLALGGLLALATIHPAHADDWLPAKKGATLFGATAAGVALGGPLGMIGGAVIGAWMNQTQDEAATVEDTRDELEIAHMQLREAETTVARLDSELGEAREANQHYAQLVLDQLQLEMLFKTNATELTTAGQQRLARLAEFLNANPAIEVRLDGYADPRGKDSYNDQLSLGRVNHVAQALEDFGVNSQRIQSFSHGARASSAPQGDYDAYALERSVKINLSQSPASGYASVD
jgi:outer membrane protein OmpA-like peptidoglycan-associated protein